MAHPKKLKSAFDEYTVRRVVGEGGAGYVLEVTSGDGSSLAAKYLRTDAVSTERLRRFRNEIHFCYRTRHDQIVRVIDHGVVDSTGSPFYVMPLYAGTLRDVMSDAKLPPQQRFDVLMSVLTGVEAAHLLGVAHRDLKPENVLFDSARKQAVIADFGIAAFVEAEMATAVETRDATRLANFKYAAPEQLERPAVADQGTDIFALGLILNEAFTGQLARGSGYRQIGDAAPDFAYLDDVVELMIHQNPRQRISSLGAVKEEISGCAKLHVARQKVHTTSRQIVSESELDDPLVSNPPQLQVKDWIDDRLFFKLSASINQMWRDAFTNHGYDGMFMGSEPARANWHGNNEFSVAARSNQAAQIREHYQAHVNRTNKLYAELAARAHQEKLRRDQREREDKANQEKERLRVLEALRKQ